jgi:hypothetical protein
MQIYINSIELVGFDNKFFLLNFLAVAFFQNKVTNLLTFGL